MRYSVPLIATLVFAFALPLPACSQAPPAAEHAPAEVALEATASSDARSPEQAPLTAPDRAFFMDAARAAWALLERNYQENTGLVSATPGYDFATTWDMGSMLGGYHSAYRLGLIDAADFERRVSRLLQTLKTVDLYDGVVFDKTYSTKTGRMSGREDRPTDRGYGWSATDIGRILVWLKIIAVQHPQFAADAQAIVNRLDFSRLVRDGYMWGEDLGGRNGTARRWQEGRIGYEQYAAAGFALWGQRPERALDMRLHAKPVTVLGRSLLADQRGMDALLSEPFVLLGLELGWTDDIGALAGELLAAQQARYEQTGQVTIVSEDAVNIPPHFFYYYCVYCDGKEFVVNSALTRGINSPRWISTKASVGWHALLPSDYTARAIAAIQPAMKKDGWHSGVLEKTGELTQSQDVNTAGIVLQAAAYRLHGGPLLGSPELAASIWGGVRAAPAGGS
jgi:hypothetical protein